MNRRLRMVYYGTLRSYRDGVAAGSFDADLDDTGRAQTVRLLDVALDRLQWVNGIPASRLSEIAQDRAQTPADINARVRDIIEGCAR